MTFYRRGVVGYGVLAVTAAALTLAPRAGAQSSANADSAWAESVLPVVRSMVPGSVISIRVDTSNERAILLGTTPTRELRLPEPTPVRADAALPTCAGSREPNVARERRGTFAHVSWRAVSDDIAIVSVTTECNLNGSTFAQGTSQRMVRGADGKWRKHGSAVAFIS